MNMGVGEAVVTEKVATGSFRKGIAGKVGSGIIEGYVIDNNMAVVRNSATNIYARYALTAWSSPSKTSTVGADIPAGARLKAAGGSYDVDALHAFNNGAMVHISGYYSGSTFIARNCYVNTNWASGSTGSYYVYFG
jgi:hypothetical protein